MVTFFPSANVDETMTNSATATETIQYMHFRLFILFTLQFILLINLKAPPYYNKKAKLTKDSSFGSSAILLLCKTRRFLPPHHGGFGFIGTLYICI
jgi:hypothetical protein